MKTRTKRKKIFNRLEGVSVRIIEPDKQEDFSISELLINSIERLKEKKSVICVQYYKETV